METKDYTQEIIDIIRSNTSPAVMSSRLEDYHANDLAEVLKKLTVQERCKLYRILDKDMLSDILEYTEADEAAEYLKEMEPRKAAAILSGMETDSLAEVLRMLDKGKKRLLIDLLDDDVRHDIEVIASFDEDEIGSRMTTNCIIIQKNVTVKEAMSSLIRQAAKNDNISTIFVVSSQQKFYGAIDLKDLIIARQDHPLEELVVTSYPYVYAEEEIDECIERLKDYSEDSVPVLDNDNRLLGVITSSSIIELVDDEMGDDYAKLAGLSSEEDLNETTKESMKKRLPWLIILLFLGMGVSAVVGAFEGVVAVLPVVICFQSLILDMAGNVGTQSLAVTIRVLMDEKLNGKDKLKLTLKEMKIGFCNGGLLGVFALVCLGVYIVLFKGYAIGTAFLISGCVGVALLVSIIISSLVGTLVPIFFKRIKVDPAVASGPLITTVNDLVAVVTYYGLAWLFLIQIMHIV